jgi:hypothetical protein
MKWVSPIITLAYCQVGKGRREEKRRGGEREERVKERERERTESSRKSTEQRQVRKLMLARENTPERSRVGNASRAFMFPAKWKIWALVKILRSIF